MDFIVSLNKPGGISSQEAVTRSKKILGVKKAGHTGTLDPMATGLLLICVNRATRLASYFSGLDKEYRGIMKLGESTDTQDASGKILEQCSDIVVDEAEIECALKSFEGTILQQPPMFSALKHKGRSLYEYARKGIEIERSPREVNISRINLLEIALPYVTFRVRCSKGTYIRTLCHDMGRKLGTCAHLYELERTGIGPFDISRSVTLEQLRSLMEGEQITNGIYTIDEALSWLPEFTVREHFIKAVLHGHPLELNTLASEDDMKTAAGIRIKSPEGDLMAIGRYSEVKNIIKMDVVLA